MSIEDTNNLESQEWENQEEGFDYKKAYWQSSKEAHKLNETANVLRNPNHLLDLHKKNPDLAESIAQSEYWLSFDEAKEEISGSKKKTKPTEKDLLKQEILNELNLEKAGEVEQGFYSKNSIDKDSDFYKDFKSIYNDLIEWKSKDPKNVERYLWIALREAKNTSKNLEQYNAALKNASIAWAWQSRGTWSSTETKKGFNILRKDKWPKDWYK